jgi:hypothetical protein
MLFFSLFYSFKTPNIFSEMSFNGDHPFSAFRQTGLELNTESGRAEIQSTETEWQLIRSGIPSQYFKHNQAENVSNFNLENASNSNFSLGNISNPSFDLVPGFEEEFDRVLSQSLTPPDFYRVDSTSKPINEFLRSDSNKFAETSFNQTSFNETSYNQTAFSESTFNLSLEDADLDYRWPVASQAEENVRRNDR